MRQGATLFFAVLLLSALISPAWADWTENFDSYPLGSGLHGQGGWHGWDGNQGADAYISDLYSRSAPQSVKIEAASDMVHEYTGATSGVWVYTAWQYIPPEFSGTSYFILLNQYHDLGPYNWSTEVRFESSSHTVVSDSDGSTLPLITGQWVELRVVIDLDSDTQTFYYGGTQLYSLSWTEGLTGGGDLNIAAVDLFANSASPVFYDDLSLIFQQPVPVDVTSWGRLKETFH